MIYFRMRRYDWTQERKIQKNEPEEGPCSSGAPEGHQEWGGNGRVTGKTAGSGSGKVISGLNA